MAIKIKLEQNELHFYDDETGYPIFWGDRLSISYTLTTDDITQGERRNGCSPYESRMGEFSHFQELQSGYFLENEELQTQLTINQKKDRLDFSLTTTNDTFSEFGLNLPFNFMGKLNGGGYGNQYLFNSPYRSLDNTYKYCFLKNPNGNHLFLLFHSLADGWKMDYSSYVGGHYFVNLKVLANFDKIYGTNSVYKQLNVSMFIVKNIKEGISRASEILNIPALFYEESYTFDGTGKIKVLGLCDKVEMISAESKVIFIPQNGEVEYYGAKGKTTFIPYYGEKKGLDCSVFAYTDIFELYKSSNDRIALWDGLPNLGNACECQCWVSAMLRYMLKKGRVDLYDKKIQEFFQIFLATQEEKAIKRLTVFNQAYNGYPPYHIFDSARIQEQAFAITILTDAYKLYRKEEYLRYAVKTLNTLIDVYQKEDGRMETLHGGRKNDYSTVCCLIIPIVDLAGLLKTENEALYEKYCTSASALAEYVYRRGFSFPTEGGTTDKAEEQMEEGSISCSALTLLYYCAKIQRNEKYIERAKELLDFHENWVIETPDANMYRSSLRWWETRWEGDGDGPALCCGHAWTIWRAEADYWYYFLTGDKEYYKKSMSSFTSNFAKFDKDGKAKSIYNADYITGG